MLKLVKSNLEIKALQSKNWIILIGQYGIVSKKKNSTTKIFQWKNSFFLSTTNQNNSNTLKNLIYGSSLGYTVKLKMVGIGYKIEIKQIETQLILELKLGFSHTIKIKLPKTLKCKRFHEKSNLFIFSFENSQYLKNVVSLIRNLRFPEPYKGKGLRYENEIIRRKEGKKNNL